MSTRRFFLFVNKKKDQKLFSNMPYIIVYKIYMGIEDPVTQTIYILLKILIFC